MTDLSNSYSATIGAVTESAKVRDSPSITALSQSVNGRFDDCHEITRRFIEEMKMQRLAIVEEIDEAAAEIAKLECLWEKMNIFSDGMESVRLLCIEY